MSIKLRLDLLELAMNLTKKSLPSRKDHKQVSLIWDLGGAVKRFIYSLIVRIV